MLVATGALRVSDLRWSRDEALRSAEERVSNLSRILSAYMGEAFASGDAALRQVALHNRRVGGPAAPDSEWASTLASARAGLTAIGAITIVDADGIIRHSTRPEIVGQSRRDQPLFRQAMAAEGEGLFVGTPFPTIATPPQLVIPIARRLTRADGTVEGLVVASFVPETMRGFFQTVNIGKHGSVWVFHPSGVVLFREPSAANPIGQSASSNPIFAAASRRDAGVVAGPVDRDGAVLISAFQRSTHPPLIVAASLDRDEVLANWRRDATGSTVVLAAITLLLVGTLLVLFRQMDAKTRAERALREAQQLEAERLRDANEQLGAALEREQGSRREAEAASALKEQFLMTISHELRTPLTAIAGWARMLVEGAVAEGQRDKALLTIERNARAQTRLVDDLLDMSRAITGKLRLDLRVVDVADIVRQAVEAAMPAAQARGIDVQMTIAPHMGAIQADPDRLQQIVWNLLSNAVKFTPSGGRVSVTAAPHGHEIAIAVSDTGVGITPEFLPHVFERFRQQEGGSARRFGGLGLGLAIARNLVELHGGSIAVESEGTGRGATFTVRLPVRPLTTEVAAGDPRAAETSRFRG